MKKEEKELKEIFVKIISNFEKNDENEIIIWDKIVKLYSNFDSGDIIEKKIYNFINLLNEIKSSSEEEFKKLMKRDIEDDLWYKL